MGDKITLRSMFGVMCVVALFLMIIRLPIVNQGGNVYVAFAVCVTIFVTTFSLYALAFLVMLPLGIIADMSKESVRSGTSPFASDRLPDQQVPVDHNRTPS